MPLSEFISIMTMNYQRMFAREDVQKP